MTFLHKLARRLAAIATTAILTTPFLASCTPGTTQEYLGPDPHKPNPSVTYIGLSITPNDPQLVQGDSIRLQARGWLPSGQSAAASVTWSATGGVVSSDGWYRATIPGSFRVRAVATTTLADSVTIVVIPPGGIARLDITPSAVPLAAGTQQQFTAVVLMGDGSRMYPSVSWSATGGSISTDGLFTAPGSQGSYTITASTIDGALQGRTDGVVGPPALRGLALAPGAVIMESGATVQFTASASWSDGSNSVPPLTWTATGGAVTPSGVYSAGATAGSFRVIAWSSLGKADTANVTILPRTVALRLSPLTALLAVGATQAVTAFAIRSDGSESPVVVQWSAEGGTISPSGIYTAGTVPGTYAVVGTLSASGTVLRDTAHFQVQADEAASVPVFVRPDTTVLPGTKVQFVASSSGDGGSVAAVSWSATGGSISSEGLYTAGPTAGSFRVVGKRKNGNKADTASVVIEPAPVLTISGFTISPQSAIIASGESRSFSATLSWSDGKIHPCDISWVSAGGTITQNGLYTAGTLAGTFLVIATGGCGAADTASVTIPMASAPAATLSKVVLSPSTVSLDAGSSQIFTVSGVWSDGATSPPPVTFTATGGSINAAGKYVAGTQAGTYGVIATQTGGSLADTSVVTIQQATSTLIGLVLQPSSATVPPGATQSFVVTATWSDGSSAVPPVTYTATGGTVSASGVYTAGATPGTYRLIATHTGGTRADTSAIVIPSGVTLTQVTLTPATVALAPGGTQQMVATGSWSDGSSVAPTVTYAATGGTISPSGLYTAGSAAGTFRIIAALTGGTKADTSAVTIGASAPPPPNGAGMPELPRVWLNTAYSPPTGQVINVAAGGNFQAALNSASCGDEIRLAAGATFTGNYVLPARQCAGNKIHIRSSGTLPPEGVRVSPSVAAGFAKVLSTNVDAALKAAPGARGYRIIAVEFALSLSPTVVNYGLVRFGEGTETSVSLLPGDIILDRSYVHGTSTTTFRRCVALNGVSTAVIDSYISDCHAKGFDAQAIGGWNGPGPFKIVNNYLEAAGENILFGGAPTGLGGSPSDIEIRRNHLFKPLSWISAGWTVKNLFELKNGIRVLVEGNVMENNWANAQTGFAVLLQSLNDGGGNITRTATVQDVTFRLNRISSSASGVNILAEVQYAGDGPTLPVSRVLFENNLFEDIGRSDLLGAGRMVQLLGGIQNLTINHNTFLHSTAPGAKANSAILLDGSPKSNGLRVTNSLFSGGSYGVFGSGAGTGKAALDYYSVNWVFAANAITDQSTLSAAYPAGNFFPLNMTTLGLDASKRLGLGSGLIGKSLDGLDIGANINALLGAISGVVP